MITKQYLKKVNLRGKQGKVVPVHAMKAYRGSRGIAPIFLMEISGQLHSPAALTPQKKTPVPTE
jgi:hypothetical protein